MDDIVEVEAADADANAEADDDADADAEDSRKSLQSQVELLESLSDESFFPLLQEQIARFNFPKQIKVRIRKMTDYDALLMNRFLKVDSITPVSKKITEVVYTVKATRFESEIFNKKRVVLRHELERVRALIANRRQWFEMYGECVAVMQERADIQKEIAELDVYIDENTPDDDYYDLDPDPVAEKELADVNRRKAELVRLDAGLRKKEYGLQSTMKQVDADRVPLEELGVVFAEDETWREDAAQESEDSLLAKIVAEEPEVEDGDVAPTNSPQGEEVDGDGVDERPESDGDGLGDVVNAPEDAAEEPTAEGVEEVVGEKAEPEQEVGEADNA